MPVAIVIAIVAGAAAIFEGLLIGYFASQKKEQQVKAERLAQRVANEEAQIEELQKTDEQTQQTMEWFRALFNNTNDMVFVYGITEDGMPDKFLEVNDAICAQLWHSREELLNMSPLEIEFMETSVASLGYSKSDLVTLSDTYVKDQYSKIASRVARHYVEQILQDGHVLDERTYQDKNGRKIPVEVIAQRFDLGDSKLIMCTAKDITERKAAETALRDSKKRFNDFFAASPVGIAIYSGQRELIDVNQACLKMFGIPDRDQFAMFNLFDNPFLSEDARKRLSAGESVRDEWVVDFTEAIQKSLFVTGKAGQAYFDIILNNMGLDRDYKPRGYFALVQDITERRKAELELQKAEVQLLQAEKMEAIGSMAGGIAHDFNNILTPIVGYAKMLVRGLKENTTEQKYALGIQKASGRAKDLVGQILMFSRKSEAVDQSSYKPIHIIPIAKEILTLQRTAMPKEIEINRVIKTEHDVVQADPTKIHQVLMNLSTNAWHAMRDRGGPGELEMMLTDFTIDPRTKSTEFPRLKPGRYLRISVKDTGTGIPPHVLKRMFEPFFTTKKVGEGTGMGLAVVHGVITSLHGEISVDTEVGRGTTFHIVLPTVEETVAEEEGAQNVPLPSGSECILIADDEQDIVEMLGHMLTSLGYQPVAANSGTEALKLFQQSPNRFDMIISDQVMPGMTGLEWATKAMAIRKDIPVMLIYAYAEDIILEHAKAAGVKDLMEKPISMENLAATIRRVFNEKKQAGAATAVK
jgi:PAS domain S-box-containing protein